MKEGWTYKKLGEVCDLYQPRTISTKDMVADGKYNVFGANGIIGKYNEYNHEHPEILMTCRGATCGNINISTPKAWINGNAMVIHIVNEKELMKDYLVHALIKIDKSSIITGAAQPQITRQTLAPLEIPLPPLSEQQRIVAQLDEAFAEIDMIKAEAEKQLSDAKALFQKALSQAMTPKEGWEKKKLGDICDIFGRIGFRGYTTKDLVKSSSEGAISLSPSNIQDGKMDYSKCTYISWFKYEESPEIKIYNGDILLVKTGSSYGKSALVENLPHEATINPQSVVLKNCNINTKYFAYYLRTTNVLEEFDKFVSGTAIPTFSQAKLSTVPIKYPSPSEQQRIVEELDELSENVKEIETLNNKLTSECDAMKQALLRQVFE